MLCVAVLGVSGKKKQLSALDKEFVNQRVRIADFHYFQKRVKFYGKKIKNSKKKICFMSE